LSLARYSIAATLGCWIRAQLKMTVPVAIDIQTE